MKLTFHKYLKKVRQDNGCSQWELAKKLGYGNPQFVSNWERGLALPPMDKLAKIVIIFKLNKLEVFRKYVSEITKRKQNEYIDAFKSAQ